MTDTTIHLPPKERELLTYIRDYQAEHGFGPTYREIMRTMNWRSAGTVLIYLSSLLNKGALRRTTKPGMNRAIYTVVVDLQ